MMEEIEEVTDEEKEERHAVFYSLFAPLDKKKKRTGMDNRCRLEEDEVEHGLWLWCGRRR